MRALLFIALASCGDPEVPTETPPEYIRAVELLEFYGVPYVEAFTVDVLPQPEVTKRCRAYVPACVESFYYRRIVVAEQPCIVDTGVAHEIAHLSLADAIHASDIDHLIRAIWDENTGAVALANRAWRDEACQ
jgi:hypothetical protein